MPGDRRGRHPGDRRGETRSRDRRLLMDGGVTSAVQDLEKRQR